MSSGHGNSTSAATNSSKTSVVEEWKRRQMEQRYKKLKHYIRLPHFIDTHGQVRLCSFLNSRNHNRRSKRCNENYVLEIIQSTCRIYCADSSLTEWGHTVNVNSMTDTEWNWFDGVRPNIIGAFLSFFLRQSWKTKDFEIMRNS